MNLKSFTPSLTLAAGPARARIALRGAELQDWTIAGRPLLWTPQPEVWPDVSPILFPVVGWTRDGQMRIGGKVYPLGLHGFARALDYNVEAQTDDFARLVLTDTDATRAQYPFAFRLALEYRLSADALEAAIVVTNTHPTAIPYACGFHPGFRWPLGAGAQEDHCIRFEKAESADVPEIAAGGLIGAATRRLPMHGRDLPLSPDLFATDARIFRNVASRSLSFIGPDARLDVAFDGFPHVAFWMRPGAPYLCIETWTGHSDPQGFDGDIHDKPSMLLLAPGESARHATTYRFSMGAAD